MESMQENRALLYSLASTAAFIVLLALGWIPELSEQFGVIDFPEEVKRNGYDAQALSSTPSDLFSSFDPSSFKSWRWTFSCLWY